MSFTSGTFIAFLLILFAVYFICPKKQMKQGVILCGNIAFYLYSGVSALAVVVFSSVALYAGSLIIERVYSGYNEKKGELNAVEQLKLLKQYKKKSVVWLVATILVMLFIMIYVKVGKFAGLQEAELNNFTFGKSVIVPLGLSYYTFSSIAYIVDVYKDKVRAEHNFFKLLLCITYFPHIVQGPIGRYDRLLEQMNNLPGFDYQRLCFGLQRAGWGYLKKLVLADTISLYTRVVLGDFGSFPAINILAAVVLYAIQLYCDFSGCMDIVLGISQILGIELDENFARPFFSKSAAEFWRRWHITLGNWFKDYIYMPIATAPKFKKRTKSIRKKHGRRASQIFANAVPSTVVWLLTGLWHGTGLDYIIWGCYWGIIIIASSIIDYEKVNSKLHIKEESRGFNIFRVVRTFLIYCGGVLIICAGSFSGFISLVKQLFSQLVQLQLDVATSYIGLKPKDLAVIAAGLVLLLAVELFQEALCKKGSSIRQYLAEKPLAFRWIVFWALLFIIVFFGKFGTGYNADAFIYAGF